MNAKIKKCIITLVMAVVVLVGQAYAVCAHSFSVTCRWASDYSKCYAVRQCIDCGYTDSVEMNVSVLHCTSGTVTYVAEAYVDGKYVYDERTCKTTPVTELFTDVKPDKYYTEAVQYCVDTKIMQGIGNNKFDPDGSLTRAQFTQILYNWNGRPDTNALEIFSDVPKNEWYAKAITWSVCQGYAGGVGGGKFAPDDELTREQLATLLWRVSGSPVGEGGALEWFTDVNSISPYASQAVYWAVENGIIKGDSGRIDPQGTATRAQAATIMYRYVR